MSRCSFLRKSNLIESLENRLLLSGTLDSGFGTGGVAQFTLARTTFVVYGTAVQADGRVLEVGQDSLGNAFIVRFTIGGSPDMTFGVGGLVQFHFNGVFEDRATAVAVQSNGNILVAGVHALDQTIIDFGESAIARFSPAGMRDTSFDPLEFGTDNAFPTTILIQNGTDKDPTNDLIVVVGTLITPYTDDNNDMYVTRYDNSGAFAGVPEDDEIPIGFGADESAFGATLDLTSSSRFQDVVIVGSSGDHNGTTAEFAIARLHAGDLMPDATFSGDGKLVVPFLSEDKYSIAYSPIVQSDGKIVIAGVYGLMHTSQHGVGVMRLNPNGSGDSTFGVSNGQYAATFKDSVLNVAMIASQTGDLLVGATTTNGVNLLCLTKVGHLDTVFNHSGLTTISGANFTHDGAFSIALAPGGKFVIGGGDGIIAERYYDRAFETISILVPDNLAHEAGSDPGVFSIVRSGPLSTGTRVYYSVGGTATAPGGITKFVDYSGVGSTVLTRYLDIVPDENSEIIGIVPKDDSFAESDETVILTLVEEPGLYDIGTPTSGTVVIIDNDGQRVSGQVYDDANGNGSKDSNETGLVGVQVYLDTNNNGAFDMGEPTTMTGPSGIYQFFGAPPGTYAVRQIVPTGFAQSDPAKNTGVSITIVAGVTVLTGKNLGDKPSGMPPPPPGGSISGMIFDDVNDNGGKDSGEPAISGIILYNDANNNGKYDTGELKTTSDTSGNYIFSGLAAGSYKIRQMLPSAYTQTSPAGNLGQTITLNANQVVTGRNFGDKIGASGPPTTGSISGIAFNDADKNGLFDTSGGDTLAGGKTVFLDTNGNGTLDSGEQHVVTDSNGNWSFTGLIPGTYHVRRVFPTGYKDSTRLIDITLKAGDADMGLLIGSKTA